MVKVVIVFHSVWGHAFELANAIAEGAKETGAEVELYQVPESLSEEVLSKMHAQKASFAHVPVLSRDRQEEVLKSADAIVFGSGTRFGSASSQLRSFIDGLGGLWFSNALVGKVGSAFAGSATQHGGNEATLLGLIPSFLHLGLIYVGAPYTISEQQGVTELTGGSPYGATYISDSNGSRAVSDREKTIAKKQGAHVATITAQLVRGRTASSQ